MDEEMRLALGHAVQGASLEERDIGRHTFSAYQRLTDWIKSVERKGSTPETKKSGQP